MADAPGDAAAAHKRSHHQEQDEEPDVGPPRPPTEGLVNDEDDNDGPAPGPSLPPPAKRRKVLEHEAVYLAALPSAEMYEKSFMHRDTISHVVRALHSPQSLRTSASAALRRCHHSPLFYSSLSPPAAAHTCRVPSGGVPSHRVLRHR